MKNIEGEPVARFELATSSLPRTHATGCVTQAQIRTPKHADSHYNEGMLTCNNGMLLCPINYVLLCLKDCGTRVSVKQIAAWI